MHIEVQEPCHENWNQMSPQEKGRHCDKCCKTVFDFTEMPTDIVLKYIAERKNENICGRFRSEQVVVPPQLQVTKSVSDRVKRFLAALVIVFGGALFTGCENTTTGKLANVDSTIQPMGTVAVLDTVKPEAKDTVPPKKDTVIHNEVKGKVKCVAPKNDEQMIQGGAVYIPEEPPLMGKPSVSPNDTVK
jgi:hypothetical protein